MRSIASAELVRFNHACPVGVLLSGGIDSSLLVGLLAEAGQKGLKTFSVGCEDAPEEKGNEFEYSDAVAKDKQDSLTLKTRNNFFAI